MKRKNISESKYISIISQICNLTTDEAGCLQDFFFLLFFTPQVSEGVNNYTKDEVEDDDNDHEEEQHVIYHSSCKQRLLEKEHEKEKYV